MRHLACWMAVAALAALVAVPAATARVPDAAASATCTKEAKRLKAFQRGMKAAKRRFFRTHRSPKARKRFVARQKRTLAARRRALRRCRAGLAHADVASVPVTTELPDIQPADAGLLRPQLASGRPRDVERAGRPRRPASDAAARRLLRRGPAGPEVAVAETASDFATGNPLAHGYTMLGLAAGTFESGAVGNLAADRVAGMWAGPDLPLRVVDLRFSIAGSTMHDRILQLDGHGLRLTRQSIEEPRCLKPSSSTPSAPRSGVRSRDP